MLPSRKSQNWLPSIFNDFFRNDWLDKNNMNAPAVNIKESDSGYQVEVATPGLTRDDFTIRIQDDNQLIVSIEKSEEKKDEKEEGRYLRREFSYSRFQQGLILPENIDKDQIQAKVENGILVIDIPKKEVLPESPKTQQIEVK